MLFFMEKWEEILQHSRFSIFNLVHGYIQLTSIIIIPKIHLQTLQNFHLASLPLQTLSLHLQYKFLNIHIKQKQGTIQGTLLCLTDCFSVPMTTKTLITNAKSNFRLLICGICSGLDILNYP